MQQVSINDRVYNIKNNDKEINQFVDEYKPFIASCVEKATGRYVRYGEDDELSIGLMAFVEAIKSYNSDKGSFLSFSKNVIKRRLIDYYRKEKRHSNIVYLDQHLSEDEEYDLSTEEAIDRYLEEEISEYRRLEIEEFKKKLAEWDISLLELVDVSPKHNKTRNMCSQIISFLLSRPDLIKIMDEKKYLPIAEIEKGTRIPRKKIERARKYIIAVLLILTGDYQYIKDYINLGVI